MSDTRTDTTRTLHAVPDPEPLAGLTGAPAAIYAELVKLTDDDTATAAELALAAGLGRSTTGKALVTLEEYGLATRTPGGHDGPRRTPDRWRTAPTGQNTATDTETGQEPVIAEPTDSTPNTPQPSADNKQSDNASADEATPDTDNVTAADVTPDTPASDLDAERSHDGASGDEGSHPAQDNHSADTEEAPVAPETDPDQPPVTQAETNALPDEKKRLAPGALRQMVIDHLSAHPGEAFTATGISRVIEKSSGAIANALDKLVKQNIAEQVSNRPRTYRLATPQANA